MTHHDLRVSDEPQRTTPCKFTVDHCTASLANGLLVTVKPQFSQNDFANVVKVMTTISLNDPMRKMVQMYPGPLARGTTHKKQVIEFCEEQIRIGPSLSSATASLKSHGNSVSSLYSLGQPLPNRSSYSLMWNLLILLLRQNGVSIILLSCKYFHLVESYIDFLDGCWNRHI